ncbi:hypothetical protein F4604DRAFT_2014127 [Suillus subluteus]|nr:hypothetical protein F4604DRAFT_2014127 [Suillus subluteus]
MVNSNPPTGRVSFTRDQIVAENANIAMRNQARQTRCNQGETNVENDKSLLVVPPSFTNVSTNRPLANNVAIASSSSSNTPSSTTNNTSTSLQVPIVPSLLSRPSTPVPTTTTINMSSMLAAFQKLSPSKQLSFQTSMNAAIASSVPATTITPNTNASSSLIFDITKEQSIPASHSIRDVYGIHTYILELARNNQHIPFLLLTSKITRHLFLESSTLKFITFYSSHRGSAPTKCHLLTCDSHVIPVISSANR